MSRLRNFVHVRDAKGKSFIFGPDDVVPAWAEAKITNPKVWDVAPTVEVATPPAEPVVEPAAAPAADEPKPARRRTRKPAVEAAD